MKKSMKPGGGGRFAKLKGQLAKKGVRDPAALAASIGRKKYGAAKMAKFAAGGKKHAHNTRIDMGEVGEHASHDEMAMVPQEEMHSAMKAPHAMTNQDMFAKPDVSHHLHALVEHHAMQAAHYAKKGAEGREMADHHRGMADAIRSHVGRKHY